MILSKKIWVWKSRGWVFFYSRISEEAQIINRFRKLQKKFKRLRRIQDDESDGEQHEDDGLDREVIAEQLFVGGSDEVGYFTINYVLFEFLQK